MAAHLKIMASKTNVWILPLAAAIVAAALPAQEAVDAVAATRLATEKWLEARNLVSKEKRDWDQAKDSLLSRSDVIRREIVALQRRIAEAETSIAEADKKRLELVAENDRQKATAAKLEEQVVALEQRVLKLLPRLPEPLRERVKPLSQLIPKPGEATRSQADQRFASVIGVLSEIHKWNREITVTSEVRALPDGSSVEVAVLYVGIGQGYYTGGNGKVGGVGASTADGWHWRPANELASAIAKTIAVFKNEQPATFVQLPAQVQ